MRTRRGMTMIEILVVLAVIAALTAVLVPMVASRARNATATAVLSTTSTLADAIGQFKADTRRYPGELRWLADPSVGTPTDICGTTIPAGLLSRWGGPYLQQHVPTAGIPAGDATVLNTLTRADPSTTDVSSLIITAIDVTQDIAIRVEEELDGDADFNGGTVRWVEVAGAASDTLKYYLPIRGC